MVTPARVPAALDRPLLVVVGGGGVGKTTLAAALGVQSALAGKRTLVMTFDPSLRLKDALGVGEAARDRGVRVPLDAPGTLDASLLDAKATFDRLVSKYAPDPAAADRIFRNRFYRDLAGTLAGILEYMAMERLFEARAEGAHDRIILDTPPTRQALDFLQAPDRIVDFLDSRAVKMALDPIWERDPRSMSLPARLAARAGMEMADRTLGRRFLEDLVEFVRAFNPLFDGFRDRAEEVRRLLRDEGTLFLLVAGPGPDRIPDAMFFLRKLKEAGHRLGPLVVNQVHPPVENPRAGSPDLHPGLRLLAHLGSRDQEGLRQIRDLLPGPGSVLELPAQPRPPSDLPSLAALARAMLIQLDN
ncbi:MAG: ArsA family ATPase [Acidobacteria bacterium]|nr:ArsA family ATPase [Acidobacteriota bacterium]